MQVRELSRLHFFQELESLAAVGEEQLARLAHQAQLLESETREDSRKQQTAFTALSSAEKKYVLLTIL